MNYKGVNCPVCQNEFRDGEDIVVCPECGRPHHRKCFKELGHCAMTELHEQGKEWENPNPPEIVLANSTDKVCGNCGEHNPKSAKACKKCGTAFTEENETVVPSIFSDNTLGNVNAGGENAPQGMMGEVFGAIHENDLIGDLPAKDFIFYVRNNYFYFLRIFKMMCQRTKAWVFNWAAFFFNYWYFFYRKMYKTAFIVLGITLVTMIPDILLYFNAMQQLASDPALLEQAVGDPNALLSVITSLKNYDTISIFSGILMYVRFGLHVFCGFIANKKYYQQSIAHITLVREQMRVTSGDDYYFALTAKGGASLRSVILVALIMLITVFVASYIMAFSMSA